MQTTDGRGKRILEMIARLGMTTANIGNTATFRRPGCEGTIPDVTFISERLANKIKEWRVLETYTASDHQYISFCLKTNKIAQVKNSCKTTRRWNVNKLDTTILLNEMDRQMENNQIEYEMRESVHQIMSMIKSSCNKAMPEVKKVSRRKEVYWWNVSIDESRRECIRTRRIYTRARRRGEALAEHQAYKEAKKQLHNRINKSKKDKWEELRADINKDPWGLGYRIVMKKLGAKNSVGKMDESTMKSIVNTLFPKHEISIDDSEYIPLTSADIPLFTIEELQTAARSFKNRKAPGPDGIPAEVIKELALHRPEILLKLYNGCLTEGIFPDVWKVQKLLLISKGKGDRSSPSSYRPLCLLDTAGKLFERLLKPRLDGAILAGGGLSSRQYGFRRGKSTIGALKELIDTVEAAQQGNHYSRPVILLATLDVKNAFNSLRWMDVIRTLDTMFKIPKYLLKIIRDYLRNRVLLYDTNQGMRSSQVTSGAAQGSILGPDLWNATYDEILKIDMPENTFLVGYADDIAAVITARNTEEAQRRLHQTMIRTKCWMDSRGLQLAMQKTELLLFTRQHIPTEIEMHIGDLVIHTKQSIKYLGMRLDSKLTYSKQIEYVTTKAAKITSQLSRLMSNIGGPLSSRRRILMETVTCILLYGSEIWAPTLKNKTKAQKLLSVQRIAALRVTSAYRTVSAQAVLVIAGMIPIDLQAIERRRIFIAKQQNASQSENIASIRRETTRSWQLRWQNDRQGRWTHTLIPNVQIWRNRKQGEVNYYITQMLSGHGYFLKYLHRMGKSSSPYCIYCIHEGKEELDDAEHTFFNCKRWIEKRRELEGEIGTVTTTNIVQKMLQSERFWEAVRRYIEYILRTKKPDLDAIN